jgi:hypothetical protein
LFTKEGQTVAFGSAFRTSTCPEDSVMRRILSITLAAATTAAALVTIAGSAEAQDRYRRGYTVTGERPLTVTRRSFLDPGPVVPLYTMQRYVVDQVYFNKTPDQAYHSGKFDFGRNYGP